MENKNMETKGKGGVKWGMLVIGVIVGLGVGYGASYFDGGSGQGLIRQTTNVNRQGLMKDVKLQEAEIAPAKPDEEVGPLNPPVGNQGGLLNDDIALEQDGMHRIPIKPTLPGDDGREALPVKDIGESIPVPEELAKLEELPSYQDLVREGYVPDMDSLVKKPAKYMPVSAGDYKLCASEADVDRCLGREGLIKAITLVEGLIKLVKNEEALVRLETMRDGLIKIEEVFVGDPDLEVSSDFVNHVYELEAFVHFSYNLDGESLAKLTDGLLAQYSLVKFAAEDKLEEVGGLAWHSLKTEDLESFGIFEVY